MKDSLEPNYQTLYNALSFLLHYYKIMFASSNNCQNWTSCIWI